MSPATPDTSGDLIPPLRVAAHIPNATVTIPSSHGGIFLADSLTSIAPNFRTGNRILCFRSNSH